MASVTPASDFLQALPTQYQSFYGSVYTAELSILSKDGFTSSPSLASATGTSTSTSTGTAGTAAGTAASTSSSKAAAPTVGMGGIKVGGAVAAGILGAALAL